ncbi:FecCD family ABC transporter permease [Streptococcus moroccensis]|uniref:Iron complex transport system permease protein n=1 Tax=Streptococcus moroccensis TaxID=1451356 RepID=A0ABT9YTA1_9STRE|nr:iron ABC transporter permease [Streptococcus moroccensis]MDQ0222588.1 iron complex transport system permease protein [Streptococcus moroccensis]
MRSKLLYLGLSCFFIVSIILAVSLGSVKVPIGTTYQIINHHLFNIYDSSNWTVVQDNIIWQLRLPRVLMGAVIGATLSVSGVCMQALTRNQLAEPFVLGVSSGASVFATLGIIFGIFNWLGVYALPFSAFLGAFVSFTFVYFLSYSQRRINIAYLLLTGVVISMICDALTKAITLSAPNALGLHNVEFWMAGSLASVKWDYLGMPVIIIALSLLYLMVNYKKLNLLLFGEETAMNLGVNVKSFQKILVIVASLLTGVSVAISGTIGFVGLICPHFARLLVGSDHKRVLVVSAILGSILVIWADVMARLIIAPEELPLGILTAILGGPFFIFFLKTNRKVR